MTNDYFRFGSRFVPSNCLHLTKTDNILSMSKKLFVCGEREFRSSTTSLLQGLFDLYRERIILIDEEDAIDDKKSIFVPLGDHAYRLRTSSITQDLRDVLSFGGWVMMFAVEEVQTIKHKGSDWFDPIVLQEALTESHLGCIVSSWYDDNEWLVAFSPDVLRLEQRRI